jgi:nitrous oxidase accessory protein
VIALAAVLAVLAAGQAPVDHGGGASQNSEPRPTAAQRSALQQRVDAAPPGATVAVDAGTYVGDLEILRPIRLVGRGRPLLVGSGAGSVVRVRSDDVVLEGLDIDGRNGGDLSRDSSGIHVTGRRVTIRDCRVRRALFGIYLREAHDGQVIASRVDGIPGRDPGEKGSGIHVWNTTGFRFERNTVEQARDGIYIQSSSNGWIVGNVVRDVRYGLHYMFANDNVFEDNLFENGAAGTAIMYSQRITFRRNRFVHNRGFASVGLLFQGCDEVVAEDNLVADNARGIFLEGSNRNIFRRNVVAESDVAIVLFASAAANRFEGNSFVSNLSPLTLVGKRTDSVFDGNYWSDNDQLDIDGDGRADAPYRLSSVFDHLRGNLTAADLMSRSTAAQALAVAERTFPVLEAVAVEDRHPLVRPPHLPAVPSAARRARGPNAPGLVGSTLMVGASTALLLGGRRRKGRAG